MLIPLLYLRLNQYSLWFHLLQQDQIRAAPNSDGLIKCLQPTQDNFVTSPKSMLENSVPFIKSVAPGQFHLPGQHLGLAGRRAGALFFARHRDYFIVTRNFTAIYLDLVPSHSFTVTRSSQRLPELPKLAALRPGTGKKQGTATQTAPNQTAGPLVFKNSRHCNIKFGLTEVNFFTYLVVAMRKLFISKNQSA